MIRRYMTYGLRLSNPFRGRFIRLRPNQRLTSTPNGGIVVVPT